MSSSELGALPLISLERNDNNNNNRPACDGSEEEKKDEEFIGVDGCAARNLFE